MRTMLLALVLALAACHKKPTIEELTKIRDRACACTDKECAEKINDEVDKMLRGVDEEKELDDKTISVLMEIGTCVARQGVRD